MARDERRARRGGAGGGDGSVGIDSVLMRSVGSGLLPALVFEPTRPLRPDPAIVQVAIRIREIVHSARTISRAPAAKSMTRMRLVRDGPGKTRAIRGRHAAPALRTDRLAGRRTRHRLGLARKCGRVGRGHSLRGLAPVRDASKAAHHVLDGPPAESIRPPAESRGGSEDRSMKDLAYVVLTLIFFIASWLYVKGLERL